MSTEQSEVLIGTCSWKFPSWTNLVYSRPDLENFLAEYARSYRSVEIDQWFWSLFSKSSVGMPRLDTVAEYLASVPSDFRFAVKAPNSVTLTHFYKKKGEKELNPNPHFLSPELLRRFFELISSMKEQTSSVMLQFEYLNKKKMASREEFLERMRGFMRSLSPEDRSWPIAVETRNPQYLRPDYFDFLAEEGLGHVFTHGYYMPRLEKVFAEHSRHFHPGSVKSAVVRLLGPDRQGIEQDTGKTWNAVVRSKDDELPEVSDVIAELYRAGVRTSVYVNNHYEGSAPLTIRKLLGMLEERGVAVAG
jgi:uncharacterized protein YecE (DUF72 family)